MGIKVERLRMETGEMWKGDKEKMEKVWRNGEICVPFFRLTSFEEASQAPSGSVKWEPSRATMCGTVAWLQATVEMMSHSTLPLGFFHKTSDARIWN